MTSRSKAIGRAVVTAAVGAAAIWRQAPSAAQDRAPEATPPGVVLSEILFDPKPGDAPFVELLNTGPQPVDVSQMALQLGDGGGLPLIRVKDPLPPNALLLIRFDGQGRVEGRTVHAPLGVTLTQSGAAELRNEHDDLLDRIAWGQQDGAVEDDAFDGTPPAGRTLGRPPGASAPLSQTEWVTYGPADATPGTENPLPPVDTLLPLDGAAVSAPAPLHWYAVTGASRYRVQVARDDAFSAMLLDTVVTGTTVNTGPLAPGEYTWRVQAIDARGGAAAFSTPSTLEVRQTSAPPIGRGIAFSLARQAARAPQTPAQPDKLLPVPQIYQHKDTAMLQLENPHRDDPHGWDRDHHVYDENDPSDDSNCAIASIAMVNHFFGGDLNQDRISYEVKSRNAARYAPGIIGAPRLSGLEGIYDSAGIVARLREKQKGPEWDFNYGFGTNPVQVLAGMTFALNPTGSNVPHAARAWRYADDEIDVLPPDRGFWRDLTAELDAGRPMMGARRDSPTSTTAHVFVVTGYGHETDGRRFLVVNDPISGSGRFHVDRMKHSRLSQFMWFFVPESPVGRHQEIGVTVDSDGDGVVDFDETERFFTDPHNADSDGDGVPDKEDIASGVFDATYGYAAHNASTKGRDFDGDGLPTERDPDSDDGGCKDGVEDSNADGVHDRGERWNFDPADDVCADINGKIEVHKSLYQTSGLHIRSEEDLLVTVRLQPVAAGVMGSLVDNGSTYTMHNVSTMTIDNGDCSIFTRGVSQGRGTFDQPDTSIGGMLYHDDPSGSPGDSGYDPGGYRIIIDARGAGSGASTVESCVLSGTSQLQGGASTPQCPGTATDATSRTFVFDCTTLPPPPPDTVITLWTMRGAVTVSPPRVGALPLANLFRRAQ